jgi:type II secretory pathway component PulJ
MNFIEAVKKFYSADKSEEEIFIVRERWDRNIAREEYSCFWALTLDNQSNLCAGEYYIATNDVLSYSLNNNRLSQEDFLAEDWRVFDADKWETEG